MSNVSQFSTTAASNNSAAPDGAPEGMAPSGVNDTIREIMAALAKWYSDTDGTLVTAGTSNAFTLTTNNVHTALADQSIIIARADRAPTGAATFNVDTLGAKTIKINHDEDVDSATWEANQMLVFIYNATDDVYELIGPSIVADLSVTTAKLAAGAVTEAKVTSVPFPRGHIGGLKISNATKGTPDTDHDIDIAIGECRDADNSGNLSLAAITTKQIDASWAVGDDAGGMASGVSLSADQWLHVFLVDLDAGGTDAGFDTSITATNLLATTDVGTKYRRIGSVLTDGSSNIIAFTQVGARFIWADPPIDVNDASPTADTAVLATLSTPLGVKVSVVGNAFYNQNSRIYISPPDANDEQPSRTAAPLATLDVAGTGVEMGTQFESITNTSSQIRYRPLLSSDVLIVTLWWVDDLGRFD